MAKAYSRGHGLFYTDKWYYLTDGSIFDNSKACKKCGHHPTKEDHDYCLGTLKGVKHACCGHGVKNGYIIFNNDEKIELKPEKMEKFKKLLKRQGVEKL